MTRHSIGYVVLVFCISSCIDEINLVMEESNRALVIDAWMGNVPEDSYVKIYRTATYRSGVLSPDYEVSEAEVVEVEDRSGKRTAFSQLGGGYRPPSDFVPEVGKEYRLVVEMEDGAVFESSWEKMPPKVDIEGLATRGYEKQVMYQTGDSQFFQTRTFADVQARIKDPGVGGLGYLVETSGISELYTSSDRDNCACTCYERDPNLFAGMNIISNGNFQGRDFGLSVGEIPLSYIGRFYVQSKLRVVTESNAEYLGKINQQQRNSGSIFDPAPARVKGNISQRGNGGLLVLGSFFLFQESNYGQLLYRTEIRASTLELGHVLEPLPAVTSACTEYYINASTVAPEEFKQ